MEEMNNSFITERFDPEHVHEVVGSTLVAGSCNECHNHRFATVSGEAIREGKSHVHEIKFTTDYADGHTHEFCGKSSPAIYVGGGKHVHFAKAFTDVADGHRHQFQTASLIDAPTDIRRDRDCSCDCGTC